jgi:hypothetical protein
VRRGCERGANANKDLKRAEGVPTVVIADDPAHLWTNRSETGRNDGGDATVGGHGVRRRDGNDGGPA